MQQETSFDAALSDDVVEYAEGEVRTIRKGFEAACRRTELDSVTLQTIRHSSAVAVVSIGVSLEKVDNTLATPTWRSHTRDMRDLRQTICKLLLKP